MIAKLCNKKQATVTTRAVSMLICIPNAKEGNRLLTTPKSLSTEFLVVMWARWYFRSAGVCGDDNGVNIYEVFA